MQNIIRRHLTSQCELWLMQNGENSYNITEICGAEESKCEICELNTHNISAICNKWYNRGKEATDDEKNV